MNEEDCKRLANIVLKHLMKDNEFKKQWARDTIHKVLIPREEMLLEVEKKPFPQIPQKLTAFTKAMNELIEAIELSIETFLSNSQLALCHMEFERNQDAASLYSVKVLLDRLIFSDSFDIDRLSHFVRRLRLLVKTFTIRISGSFQVANCAFYSHSLLEILSKLIVYYDNNSIHIISTDHFNRLKAVSKDFSELVEKRLSNCLITFNRNNLKNAPLRENQSINNRILKYEKPKPQIQKNFLLPQDHIINRMKIKKLASDAMKNKNLTENDLLKIKKKWKPLFDSDNMFYSSLEDDIYGHAALRISNNLTKNVWDKIKNNK
uniref:Uncharacterized protein n=1 Tax=Parastrongyloides trichosuri TaxID=131310 RepID=A0A0N4ZU04_PARTI